MRFNVTMEDDLVSKIDALASSSGLSRSAFIRNAVSDFISAQEKAPLLRSVLSGMIISTGSRIGQELDDDQYRSQMDSLQSTFDDILKK